MLRRMIVFASVALALSACIPAARAAQAQAKPPSYRYANPWGKWLSWALYPQMQKELEIIPEQKAELEKIREEITQKTNEMYKSLGQLEPAERQEKMYEQSQALADETDQKVEKVLLPHQRRRLDQIMLQMQLRNTGYGSAQALGGEALASALGITEQQKEQLRKKEEELRAGIQKKTQEFFKKLNEETREELLSVLTPAQRQKLREMLGDDFQWQTAEPRQSGEAEGRKP